MSAILTPPTKNFGARPPIFPPTTTTFAGGSDDNHIPRYRVIAESVEKLVQSVKSWPDEDTALLLRLLEQRAQMVEKELEAERLLLIQELPPTVFGDAFPLDYLFNAETEAVGAYLGLLGTLYDSILRVRRKLSLLKDLLPSSEA
jgi:hypothetical protein